MHLQSRFEWPVARIYTPPYSAAMEISARLDKAMREAGIKTQAELVRLSGVSQPTVSRILKNQGPRPGAEVLGRLAAACGVSVEWLMRGTGKQKTTAGAQAGMDLVWLNQAEIHLITNFRSATDKGREMIDVAAETAPKKKTPPKRLTLRPSH
jgi:transcriptional regulator with XRE-family HTH domain